MMIKKNISAIIFIFITIFPISCCFHRTCPMLPRTWSANECNSKSLEDNDKQAKLHVMVMYNEGPCSHVALRLYCQDKGPIFWDPAGGFANEQGNYGMNQGNVDNEDEDQELSINNSSTVNSIRFNDVTTKKAPSINEYLAWRKTIKTHAAEIFEFNISEAEAENLWDILRNGTTRSHPKGKFHTNAIGGTCGLSIAKFLHRFAEDIIKVNSAFYPHNLAKQLYKQNPDRVIIYRDGQLDYYIPLENYGLVGQKVE